MAARWLTVALVLATAAVLPARSAWAEAVCPRAGTLGVSRTVEIDTTGGPGFGMEHYKAYDFLQPKEVILTFDDGPQKYTTEDVLKALADECTKATFFSIGKMALGYPEIIREVASAGHTIGTHTWSHKAIGKLKTFDEGKEEIERGFSAVHRAVGGPIAPFFRFPTLVDTPEAVAYLGKRNIAMFSTDIDSFDFKPQTADHVVKSVMEKLDKRGKGIILMHDIHKTTAKALPALLAQLKAKGYKIVHVTAKAPVVTLPDFDATIEKEAKGLPQVGAERPLSSIVKTVGDSKPAADAPVSSQTSEPAGMPDAAAPLAPASKPAVAPSPIGPKSQSSAEPEGLGESSDVATTKPSPAAPVTPITAAPSAAAPTNGAAANLPAFPVAPSTPTPAPMAQAANSPVVTTAPQLTTSSVVKTVSGEDPDKAVKASASTSAPAATSPTAPPGPQKSLSERAKETWELWFGQ